jgi:hypothetical protein
MRSALAPLADAARAAVVEIDVDTDPALEREFGERVPVLLDGTPGDGVELCRYRLDAGRVARALAAPR